MPKYTVAGIRDDIVRMGQLASSRVQDALRAFEKLDLKHANRIIEADDVFDVLNLSIEEKCHYMSFREMDEEEARFLRSAVWVGKNLEHIGDAACHIAKRVSIAHHEQLKYIPFDLGEMEPVAMASIRESLDAYLKKDLKLVEEACLREPEHDGIYVERLIELKKRMRREPDNISFLLLWYSVMKYLEKVSDYTLNIGEQAIFLATGRRLKFSQYQQLDRILPKEPSSEYRYYPYYDGISGAITARMENHGKVLVYKEGSKRKIAAEAAMLQEWQNILPSMAPRIVGTQDRGDRETLLREFVSGTPLSDIYLENTDLQLKLEATHNLIGTLTNVWKLTYKEERPPISYAGQIRSRLNEVYAMHPYLEYLAEDIKLIELLKDITQKEAEFAPGFSVLLHGDFNINNVFYNNGQVQFIDVHRSHRGDYLEDIGVFLVSTMRAANLPESIRQDMEKIRAFVTDSAAELGKARHDDNFARRLNLSMARSYITSSRIIVDKQQARSLFENGVKLLKSAVDL